MSDNILDPSASWVADLAALTEHLDLRDAIHIGHSTGGGEVARYVARHQERVAKAALVASLTPNMYRSEDNPSGQPPEWFEAIRAGVLGNRSEFYRFVPENPFYGYNRDGAKPSEAIIANWWRQGMAGGALAHYATVDSWLEDYTEDLKKITVPVLVMHGEADQVVPFASSVLTKERTRSSNPPRKIIGQGPDRSGGLASVAQP
jgi:non-heme chloroperoxidase